MAEGFINIPIEGIITDIDKSKVPATRMSLSENVRLFDRDGGDYMGKPIKANTYSFSLTSDFKYLGHFVRNGIAFIFSKNSTGECEIGSFPSPKQLSYDQNGKAVIDTDITGFKEVYQPLPIYDKNNDGGKYRLTTNLLGFVDKGINGFAKSIYDHTFNLYYTDKENPIRVINSGFDINGIVTSDHDLIPSSFEININLFQGSGINFIVNSSSYSSGGKLDFASYFIYFRYATESLDYSDIIYESGPYMIYDNTENTDEFEGGNTYLNEVTSNKKIILDLSNIDESYKYLEMIISRRTSDENGLLFVENFLVDKRYTINNTSMQVELTGYETLIPISDATIFDYNSIEDRAEYIHFLNNRLWGCYWKKNNLHNSALSKAALNITPLQPSAYELEGDEFRNYLGPKDETLYFPAEIYPFTVQFVYTNGNISDPYPIKGCDFYSGSTLNEKGLIRFPGITDNMPLVLYKLNLDLINLYDGLTSDEQTWFQKNIKQLFISRGERYVNRLGMGMTSMLGGSRIDETFGDVFPPGDGSTIYLLSTNNISIPCQSYLTDSGEFQSDIPACKYVIIHDWNEHKIYYSHLYVPLSEQEKKMFAVFSPDLILHEINDIGEVRYVEVTKNATVTKTEADGQLYEKMVPSTLRKEVLLINDILNWDRYNIGEEKSALVGDNFLENSQQINNRLRVVNEVYDSLTEPNSPDMAGNKPYTLGYGYEEHYSEGVRYESVISSRNMSSPKYLAIELDEVFTGYDQLCIFYKQNPSEIVVNDVLDPKNVLYNKITSPYDIDSLPDQLSIGKGDATCSIFSLKSLTWNPSSFPAYPYEGDSFTEVGVDVDYEADDFSSYGNKHFKYAHGLFIRFKGNFSVNTDWRNSDAAKTFYPKCKDEYLSIGEQYWSITPRSTYTTSQGENIGVRGLESFLYNKAYNGYLSERKRYGFDPVNYISQQQFEQNTRIRYTATTIPGELRDSLRVMTPSAYQDFDQKNGNMLRIGSVNGVLISFQESAINQHFINEKNVKIPSDIGELIIGQGSIISDRVKVLAQYGVQSELSIVETQYDIVGFDYIRSIPFRVFVDRSGLNPVLKSVDLGEQLGCHKLLKDNIGSTLETTNASTIQSFDPLFGNGVIASYEPEYKEVWFSNPSTQKTVIYDHARNIFTTVRQYASRAHISLLNDFYSFYDRETVWRENSSEEHLKAYGKKLNWRIGFVVNGVAKEKNMGPVKKIFESILISSSDVRFTNIEFITETQKAVLSPFYSKERFWMNPIYNLSKWEVPVPQSVIESGQTKVNSEMRGQWMEVILKARSSKDFFVRQIESLYNIEV